MKKILIVISLALLLVFPSCRPDIQHPGAPDTITTWAELFEAWWADMSKNYVFWSLDAPEGHEWDDVLEENLPIMESYGEIGVSESTDKEALRVFFDLVKNLHDGHHRLSITNGNSLTGAFSPLLYRSMLKAGMTDDEAFEAMLTASPPQYSQLYATSDFVVENTLSIMQNTFGISGAESASSLNVPFEQGSVDGFKKSGYLKVPKGTVVNNNDVGNFAMFLGITDDDILYLVFSGFDISYFISSYYGGENNQYAEAVFNLMTTYDSILSSYAEGSSDLNGIIIDLRGNGGGNPLDFYFLYSNLIPENLKIAKVRIKQSDNRYSYTHWNDFSITGYAENDAVMSNLPITVLTNMRSVSCSEISCMAFMAMREEYGADIVLVGGTTAGGNGPLAPMDYLNAGSSSIMPYISLIYTPGMQLVYRDGTSYEGKGIDPDIEVDFNYSQFISGTDSRLRVALDYIRSKK
ncbi:MAG: hypothetical protein IAA97_05395 [Spirochaetes bacterium]|uniref:Tail specific protease domain-containing protein n=1 Tax=Candidatus Ornithospirochaeta stercoripullorum TaxID=2840899 RepID=A0A9D9E0V8_9SPIO|nr:hypothetical protein [Candidatus Ornithospirochaeta stercoripullorum]